MTIGEATAYPGSFLLQNARAAATDPSRKTYTALGALLFSALAVEASLSELLHRVQTTEARLRIGNLGELIKVADRQKLFVRNAKWKDKCKAIVSSLEGAPPNWSIPPFRGLQLLFELRNALVHSTPERLPLKHDQDTRIVQAAPHELVVRLAQEGVALPSHDGAMTSLHAFLLHEAVPRWAHNAAVSSIARIRDSLPPNWNLLTFTLYNLEPLQPLPAA